MKVLISKLGALGDLIHSLPALTDAANEIPGIQFDWIVEEVFGEIPTWHPNVNDVFHWSSRRWRKGTLHYKHEILQAIKAIRQQKYDVIIESQGILKATLPALLARGPLWGYDHSMIGDSLAAVVYRHKYKNDQNDVHASTLVRGLFASALGYEIPRDEANPGIAPYFKNQTPTIDVDERALVLLHGTTWPSKHVPLEIWHDVIEFFGHKGWKIYLPSLGAAERERAEKLAKHPNAHMLPALSLTDLATIFSRVGAVIGPDTGLCHVASALGTPTLVLYGPSKERFYRPLGPNAQTYTVDMACAPCMLKTCPKVEFDITPPCWNSIDSSKAIDLLLELLETNTLKRPIIIDG